MAELKQTIIAPSPKGFNSLQLRELWQYRELFWFMTCRHMKVRYKQTALGVSWAILQPLLTMLVFSIFFGRLAQIPSDGVPYSLFVLTGLLPWIFFANGLAFSANSLVGETNLITKIYFPRLIIPISSILPGVVDLLLGFGLLLITMYYYEVALTWRLAIIPAFLLLSFLAVLGSGLWFSSLNVHNRDIRHTVPFVIQLGLFSTPVAYSASLIPEKYHLLAGLNPMVGAVEGFRWCLIGTNGLSPTLLWMSVVISLGLSITGLWYFKKMEKEFADVI